MDEGENLVKRKLAGGNRGVPKRHYHGGWANLAAAIITSGLRANDERFLESDWCELLQDMCELDAQMYDHEPTGVHIETSQVRGLN